MSQSHGSRRAAQTWVWILSHVSASASCGDSAVTGMPWISTVYSLIRLTNRKWLARVASSALMRSSCSSGELRDDRHGCFSEERYGFSHDAIVGTETPFTSRPSGGFVAPKGIRNLLPGWFHLTIARVARRDGLGAPRLAREKMCRSAGNKDHDTNSVLRRGRQRSRQGRRRQHQQAHASDQGQHTGGTHE